MSAKKYEWYVVCAYDFADYKKGDVYSRHTTYKLARKMALQFGNLVSIKNIHELGEIK